MRIRSFCLYIIVCVQPPQYFAKCIQTAWGICFYVHSYDGVWRYQLFDERDKSLRFSCVGTKYIIADFGGLVGNRIENHNEKGKTLSGNVGSAIVQYGHECQPRVY